MYESTAAFAMFLLLDAATLRAASQPPTPRPDEPLPAATETTDTADADDGVDAEWTRWTSGRYRITPGDVLELKFPFVPELDQTLTVQPDGYVTLREAGDVRVQGHTLPELRAEVLGKYVAFLRDPAVTIVLKEFEKPYFIASGEIAKPGRYELRGATTLTQALAYAGGPSGKAKLSEVVLFRRFTSEAVSVRQIDVKKMYDKRDLSEDPLLRPGDMILVPKSLLGKLAPVMPRLNMGLYFNPMDFIR
jgi:polysaccharide export outer membrane protein